MCFCMKSTEHVSAVWSKLYLTLVHQRRIGIWRCRWVCLLREMSHCLMLKVYWVEEKLCLLRDFRFPLRCRFLLGFLTLEGRTR